MQKASFIFLFLLATVARAQFAIQVLPIKQSDFKMIKAGGYTKCFIYKMIGEEKILVKEVEYGAQGLPAAFYEKGTNSNGDSVNTGTVYYKFDGKGKLIHESATHVEEEDQEVLYTYDSNGRLVKKEVAHIDPPTYTYKYDATGKLKEIYVTQKMPSYDDNGDFKGKTIQMPSERYLVTCDAKGRIIQRDEYNLRNGDKNRIVNTSRWKYDDRNNIIEYSFKSNEGANAFKIAYTYNAEGLLTRSKEIHPGSDNETEELIYEYCKTCKQSWMK